MGDTNRDEIEYILFVSELFYPEENATGYFLTGIAEGLSSGGYEVSVICAQPGYNDRGTKAPVRETRHGVFIRRCWSSSCDHRGIFGRALNFLTTSLSLGWRALWEIRRGKTVMVVTNPPLVPFMVRMACWLKGGRFVLLVHDVYPEVFVSVGWMRRGGIFFRLLDIPNQILLRSCREIIVLGRDMKELIAGKLPERCRFRVHTIPNWAMDEVVAETPSSGSARERFGIPDNAFLLVYNGNHGRTHFLEVWVALAAALLDDDRFRFLFAGEGSGKAKFEEAVERAGITNLHTTSFVSREDLASLLHSADLLLVSFFPGMAGVSVPSRLYNLMAASRPVLAVADSHSEVSQVLAEEDCGWAFPPEGSPQEIAAKIAPLLRELVENRDRLKEKGENGRKAVLEKYTREKVIEQYREVLTTFERSDTQSNGVTGEANGHR